MKKDKILRNINTILSGNTEGKLFKPLNLSDLNKFYNEYSLGIDTIAKSVFDDLYSSGTIKSNEFPDKFPKQVNDNMLYRGATKRYPFFLMTPQTRISKDTTNVYTLLMSEILPSWENFPKRNRSIISTDSIVTATEYTDRPNKVIFNVIPPNNAKLVVSKVPDVWNAFRNINNRCSDGLPAFNKIVVMLMGVFDYFKGKGFYSYNEIKEFLENHDDEYLYSDIVNYNTNFRDIEMLFKNIELNQIYEIIDYMDILRSGHKRSLVMIEEAMFDIFKINNFSSMGIGNLLNYLMENYYKYEDFVAALNHILNPIQGGFRLINYNQLNQSIKESDVGREIWTESPCLLMDWPFYSNTEFLTEYFKIIS